MQDTSHRCVIVEDGGFLEMRRGRKLRRFYAGWRRPDWERARRRCSRRGLSTSRRMIEKATEQQPAYVVSRHIHDFSAAPAEAACEAGSKWYHVYLFR